MGWRRRARVSRRERAAVRLSAVTVFAARLAWQADRTRLLVVLGLEAATAAGLGLVVLTLRHVLGVALPAGQAVAGGMPAGADVTRMLPGMAVLAVLGTLAGFAQIVINTQMSVLRAEVEREATSRILVAAAAAEPARFEDPCFHDRIERAVSASRGQPIRLLYAALTLVKAMISTLAVGAAFAAIAWWLLPLLAVAAVPVVRTARTMRLAQYDMHRQLAENRRVREYLQRLLTGREEANEVRALRLGGLLLARWHARYADDIAWQTRLSRTFLWRQLAARTVSDAVVVGFVGVVVWLARTGRLSVASALAVLGGMWLLSERVRSAGYLLSDTGQTVLYINDLAAFAAEHPQPGLECDREPAVPVGGSHSLSAEHVCFAYPGADTPALRDVSVTLGAGQVVALVGANGSGKTTLAKILAGVYPPDRGRLLLDGDPVDDHARLRDLTAVVFQDFLRFRLSAADNIGFGRPAGPPDPAGVTRAAELAGIHPVLAGLAHGYDTVLGKEFTGGADLSLGQWQRLALARAFYRDAPFVILDEPTAALDAHAEAALFAHIRGLFAGRTVLLISHRLYSVRDADRIYVLAGGRVVEDGTHDDLIARNGCYADLFLTQAAAYLDPGPSGEQRPVDRSVAVDHPRDAEAGLHSAAAG